MSEKIEFIDLNDAKVRENLERFHYAMDATQDGIWDWNIVTGEVYYSPGYLRMLGYEENDAHYNAEFWMSRIAPEFRENVLAANLACINNEIPSFEVEFKMLAKNNQWRWIIGRGKAVERDCSGKALRMVGTHVDVSRFKETLKVTHDTYKGIFNSASDMIYIQDENGRFLDINDAVVKNYGYSRAEVIGKMPDFLAAEGKNNFKELGKKFASALAGQNQRMEFWGRKSDGTIFPKDLSLAPGRYFEQKVVIAVARDISEEKKAEIEREKLQSQLLQIQKMDSVGRLAGGVAHDFNNMLNVILGHAELALDKLSPAHPLVEDLTEIRKAASRSADLTRQLLAFARKQTAIPRVLNLNETLNGMLKMLTRLIGENIELIWKPSADLWPVKIDPSQLDQILANLCVNARDAISENGVVEISTRNFIVDISESSGNIEFQPGNYIVLSVNDNGHGMSRETIDSLFEPFFTTKEIGKGTGLGLATVYGIVKQNHGLIKVESSEGIGTKFEIFFPRYDGNLEMRNEKGNPTESSNKSGTVMFVEDEKMILNMGKLMLEKLGFKVITASSPIQALTLAKETNDKIDVLLTDVIMPEMNGKELARQIQQVFPEIKLIFISGYTANIITPHGVLEEGVHFMQKPFSLKKLASKLQEVLG